MLTRTCLRAAFWFALAPLTLGVATAASAQDPDRCGPLPDVLRLGFNETEISSTVNEARDLYRLACSEQSGSSGTSTNESANVGWDNFSADVKRGSSSFENYRQNNCRLSENTVTNYVASSLRQRTIDPAVLDTWASCLELDSGISLGPNVREDQTFVSFNITYDDERLAESPILRGISSETFACRTAGEGLEIGVGGEPVQISPRETLVIECHRGSESSEMGGRPVTVYQRDSLLLDLSTGGHRLDFTPHREGPAVEEFAELQGQVRNLRDELDALENAHQETTDRFEILIGRQWHNVTSVRQDDQCYMNNTNYPLEVAITTDAQSNTQNFCQVDVFVEDERIIQQINNNVSYAKHCAVTATVPPRARYHVNDDGYRAGRIVAWWELRARGDAIELQNAQCR